MRRIEHDSLPARDRVVMQGGGGVARTPEQYALFSSGWEVRPIGEPPHATAVKAWRGQSIFAVHCTGTPVSVRRGPEHLQTYGDWLQLVMPLGGSLSLRQGTQAFDVLPGELGAVSYREEFTLTGHPGTSMFLVYLSVQSLRSRGLAREGVAGRKWVDGYLLRPFAVLLEELFEEHTRAAPLAVENTLLEMVANIMGGATSSQRGDGLLRSQVVRLIGQNFDDPDLNADWLAGQVGVSRRTLYSLASEDDTSIAEMIRTRRISHARHLLEAQPELPLRRVAKLCGYRGPDQLSRTFREAIGLSPSAFRNAIAADGNADS